MNHMRGRSSGFILLTAILMIAIVAVALVSMTTAASSQSRHQSSDVQRAQLEQLLFAGTQDTLSRYSSASPPKANESFKVELPERLAGTCALEVHIDVTSGDSSASATVRATMNGELASQTISLTKSASAWQLKSAALN
jgi:hypothetical protein